jgi:thiaminase/transcriptional activator TenA
MSFSQKLKEENRNLWDKILAHKFIQELGSGTLPIEKFIYYIKQDYLYLIDFARCIGLAASKAKDIESMRGWAQRMDGCLRYETLMLEDVSEKLGISKNELENSEKSPTNTAYLNHLLMVAYTGNIGENIAALLPCMWTYLDVGTTVNKIGGFKGHPVYEKWCSAYGAPEYRDLVQTYINVIEETSKESGKYMKNKIRSHFRQSLKYEYMFWEMAYNMEKWII